MAESLTVRLHPMLVAPFMVWLDHLGLDLSAPIPLGDGDGDSLHVVMPRTSPQKAAPDGA